MAEDRSSFSSRRALLTAAASGAAALAASAALPLAVAAGDPNDVVKGVDNPTTATTSISNGNGDTSFGLQASSTGGAGIVGWSITAPDSTFTGDVLTYTGVFGSAPAGDGSTTFGAGVWGDSADTGVFGTGATGVYGIGAFGVIGSTYDPAGAGVQAYGATDADLALDVHGKVKFNRSGKAKVSKNKSSVKVTLAGVTTSSRIFAVCYTNRSARWVRAAVPHSGYFYLYMNTKVTSTTYVSWFVLN